jgi:hypothetical protein
VFLLGSGKWVGSGFKLSIDSHVVCGQFKGLGFKPQTLTPFTQLKSPFEVWVFFFSWFQPLNEVRLQSVFSILP